MFLGEEGEKKKEKEKKKLTWSLLAYTFFFQQFQYKVTMYPLSAMWNSS